MILNWLQILSNKFDLQQWQIENTFELYKNEFTIPFIARYRKEKTGELNEVVINNLFREFKWIEEFEKRKKYILKSIEKQSALTDNLRTEIENCYDIYKLEDIYLPYKPKKKTKAKKAYENGLEPLAKIIFEQNQEIKENFLCQFVNNEYNNQKEVLRGAKDIIVEWIAENKEVRNIVRQQFNNYAFIESKIIKTKIKDAEKYRIYFDFKEKLSTCPAYRILAMFRGKEDGFLRINIKINDEYTLSQLKKILIKNKFQSSKIVEECLEEAYNNYILPSLENEFFQLSKKRADIESVKIFAENLKQLLLTPPLGEKRVLAIDPGYKTGCKIVCLDEQGRLLHNETIYPHPPQNDMQKSEKKIISLVDAYKIECIALGDGTASRETEKMLSKIAFKRPIKIYVVSEAGASIYSASEIAREEFPKYDVTVRGAISIGRRLQDPLAELVKIDPKSIGVGQYQHDVDQKLLKQTLEETVIECVNKVGIKLNTASLHLLKYVSGIGDKTAKAIIEHRNKIGRFNNINELLDIPGFNLKTFQLSSGFLRIENGSNPLDNTGIHPEHYFIVEKMAKDLNISIDKLIGNKELLDKININNYVSDEIGKASINDILYELNNPGYDVRLKVKVLQFSPEIIKFEDLKVGMILNGIITNITHFGAFVNVGIKENGLVHISNISNDFISNPLEKIHIHQHVKVKVIAINNNLKQFQLSMKDIE